MINYAPELDAVVVRLYNNDGGGPELGLANVLNPALSLLSVED